MNMNNQINTEAAEWFVELNTSEPDEASRRKFDRWLRASPQHARAYLEMFPVWHDAATLGVDETTTAERLIALARGSTNVVPWEVVKQTPLPQRRTRLYSLAASLLAGVTLIGLYAYAERGVYATDIGEQRTLALEDGTTIELNARSRLKVRYSATQRTIELTRGQALFSVAKDTSRPFVVDTGQTRIRAVGTQFDVYRKPSGTVVTVFEGKVAITPASDLGPSDAATLLLAGQQLAVTPNASTKATTANVVAATAWRQRRVVFSATPLREVVEEFNRYNDRQLVLGDDTIEAIQISGVFSATDLPSLMRFLRAQPGVVVTEHDREIHIDVH